MQLFATRLMGCRTRLGLTQEEFAKKINMSRRSVANWESGEREPRGKDLRKISEILGVPVAYLTGEDGDPSRPQPYREELPPNKNAELRQRCHDYLDEVLDAANSDEDNLRWTIVELKRAFPLERSHGLNETNSASPSLAKRMAKTLLGGKSPPST